MAYKGGLVISASFKMARECNGQTPDLRTMENHELENFLQGKEFWPYQEASPYSRLGTDQCLVCVSHSPSFLIGVFIGILLFPFQHSILVAEDTDNLPFFKYSSPHEEKATLHMLYAFLHITSMWKLPWIAQSFIP